MKISVYMDDELVAQLDGIALKYGITRNAVIVRALYDFAADMQKKESLEKRVEKLEGLLRKAASGCCLHAG
jgi:predicted transcriptional regulator